MAHPYARRLARVADRLESHWGLKVERVPGWERRGRKGWRPTAHLQHHTASPPGSSDTASLRVVTFGRSDLGPNALSQWYTSRSAVVYLIAAGLCWHAGRGQIVPSSRSSGLEQEHAGTDAEPWTDAQLHAARAIAWEMAHEFGWDPAVRTWEHKEHAPRRKIDRWRISGSLERHLLDTLRRPTDTEGEDDEMRLWHVNGNVYLCSGVTCVHVARGTAVDDAKGAYGLQMVDWPGSADSFVDAHVILKGGGDPRPPGATATS